MNKQKMFDLTGRTALVTGSSRGIGLEIAMWLADAGSNVVFHGSRPSGKLDNAVMAAEKMGVKAVSIPADLGNSAEVVSLAEKAVKAFGHVDILVQNASVQEYMTIEEFTDEEFTRECNCNLRSTFELVKLLLPGMKERGWGRIVTIGSVNQMKPLPRLAVYSSIKSAAVNLMMNMARGHSGRGVTFNNVAPGVILTDRNEKILENDEFRSKILEGIPAGRFGLAEDCAGLVLLLCSDAGSYITGADIPVTGGMHL